MKPVSIWCRRKAEVASGEHKYSVKGAKNSDLGDFAANDSKDEKTVDEGRGNP